ncbi:MAG: N-acetylornithine carbamoyltransferase [Proteobacteria bacterium]|nr:N-acetylornithine carbamoyltransferase [Pseudomonadota bacterium]
MKQFLSASDVNDLPALLDEAFLLKSKPFAYSELGRGKTLGLVFFNASLRTRLSTQKAAQQLGLHTLLINVNQEGWMIETHEGTIMDGLGVEHLKEAAGVLGVYCDIIAVRSFPSLKNRQLDESEHVLRSIARMSQKPIISLEGSTAHPLQALADIMTIIENSQRPKPKVVLSWAPHIKALPQAVPNSFAEWSLKAGFELVITHPKGYELDPRFTQGASITHDQNEALRGAEFVYAKNWSSYESYGQILCEDRSWTLTAEKMALTKQAAFMHCLPVRRNLEVSDAVLDSPASLVLQQAKNRIFAAQVVLKRMLETI